MCDVCVTSPFVTSGVATVTFSYSHAATVKGGGAHHDSSDVFAGPLHCRFSTHAIHGGFPAPAAGLSPISLPPTRGAPSGVLCGEPGALCASARVHLVHLGEAETVGGPPGHRSPKISHWVVDPVVKLKPTTTALAVVKPTGRTAGRWLMKLVG